jgi:hypothetical protein
MKLLFRYEKKADKTLNRIIIPKIIIDKYGRDFYLEYYDDETIKLVPIEKQQNNNT